MIVNIRGTGGSGKSTVVRRIMELFTLKEPHYIGDRKQPYYYHLANKDEKPCLFVPGHYETPTGGCDTLKTVDEVYRILQMAVDGGDHAIFEGIIAQDDVRRAAEFAHKIGRDKFLVLVLTTPIEECLKGIQERRDVRGDDRPLDPKNTVNRAKRVIQIASRLKDAGLTVEKHDRESAFLRAKEALGL